MHKLIIFVLCFCWNFVSSSMDEAFCSIVAATNIGSIKSYEMWNCTLGLTNSNPCTWNGVICNDTEVNSIILSGLLLTGTIPSGLFGLSSLSSLDISKNQLSGIFRFYF